MKTSITSILLFFVANLAFAGTDSMITQFDRLIARRTEVEARKHEDREVEDIYRELVSIAYTDLMAHTDTVFKKGMDRRWAERLANLPQSPHELFLRDKEVGSITKQLLVTMEESNPPLGAHFLQRCWLSRALAVYFSKQGDYESAKNHINTSTSYLALMEENMADSITEKKMTGFIRKSRDENRDLLVAVEAKLRTRQEVANMPGSSKAEKSGATSKKTETTSKISKTFTVTSDARANQTGDEAGASGESSITVRGDGGAFTVRYWYDWPSSYLISAGRGKSLEGKSVTIQFDGEKATYISCGTGSGKCQIKSFSRQ